MISDRQFEEIFRLHYNALVLFVHSLGVEPNDAEDLVQTVFVKFWNLKDQFLVEKDPKPYLFQAAKNAAYNHFRDLRSKWSVSEFEQELAEEPQVETKIRIAELETHIDQLIDNLPARCRMVFILSRKEGLSHKQIAEILDISAKTVENQITKALKIIRQELE